MAEKNSGEATPVVGGFILFPLHPREKSRHLQRLIVSIVEKGNVFFSHLFITYDLVITQTAASYFQ